jgi:hypothetical protein
MLPRLHVGDVAVSRPVGAVPPTIGSVLLFDDPDRPDRLRLHRFVGVADDGRLVTRGDANADDDSSPVALSAVHGIATLRVPWVGLPVVWSREREWLPLAAGILVLLALAAVAAQSYRFGFPEPAADDPEDPDSPGAASGTPDGDQEPPWEGAVAAPPLAASRVGGALVVAVLLGLLPAAPAGAAFAGTTTTAGSLAAATYFKCANAVAAATPYLWYRMDETSSTITVATDSSGGARNGVYSSAGKTAGAVRACTRDSGSAMTFNGTSGYASSPLLSTALPNTFTLAVWFKTSTTQGGKLVGFGNAQTGASTSYDRHLYMTNAGKLIFGVQPGSATTVASPLSYNNGAWHQAVATLSATGMGLYVDGNLVASNAMVTTAMSASSGYLRIAYDNLSGWPSPPTSRFFSGTLDDVAFYSTALSAAQVAAQHQAGT